MWEMLLPALAIAGGTFLASSANKSAANTAVAGINNATAIQQATDNSIATSGGVGPGSSYLRSLVADPGALTPAQQEGLAEVRRGVTNQIHGSDFAGSGRTAAALFKDTENNYVNTALQANKSQAINAADRLSSTSTTAAIASAQAGSSAATATGNIEAQQGIATGKLYGQALGDVSSLISRQSKLNQIGT